MSVKLEAEQRYVTILQEDSDKKEWPARLGETKGESQHVSIDDCQNGYSAVQLGQSKLIILLLQGFAGP